MNSQVEDTLEESFRNSRSAPLYTHLDEDDEDDDLRTSTDII